ncbi:dihydrofolate reductase family protein, partial [Klebsiella pneumoniae]|uniref:dihydrofolate reductase family protein n=1 Tax=Klebsiella pneumoniae TaxID=573 RepID=UPI0038554C9E
GDDDIDDASALAALSERGLTRVLCEGGPTVVTRLLRAGLVDELCLTFAPLLAGPGHAGLGAGAAFERAARLDLIGLLSGGDGTLFARYAVQPGS